MRTLRIRAKIAVSYTLLGVVLLTCGGAGYYAADSISRSLDYISGPVWRTDDLAHETAAVIRDQVVTVEHVISGADGDARTRIQTQDQRLHGSVSAIRGERVVDESRLATLEQGIRDFISARDILFGAHEGFERAYTQLGEQAEKFLDLLVAVEELASRKIIEAETNWDPQAQADTTRSDEWFAANAATESRLNLFARLYHFQRLLDRSGTRDLAEALEQAGKDLEALIDQFDGMELYRQPVEKGPFAGQVFHQALHEQLKLHLEQVDRTLAGHQAMTAARAAYGSAAERVMSEALAVGDLGQAATDEAMQSVAQTRRTAYQTILIAVTLGLLTAVVAYVASLRTIASPIDQAAGRLRAAQQNHDLTVSLEVRGDEIGDMATCFNTFCSKVRALVERVGTAAEQVVAASVRVAQITEQTDQAMVRQRQETDQVAAAVRALTGTAAEVAGNATAAADAAEQARAATTDGMRVVEETVTTIQGLAREVERTAGVVRQLDGRSREIGSVIDVINSVAEQTNLLALNAAIEAARAGEQGRGFAVVADEVRTLASRTQESTRQIEQMIGGLQADVKNAVEAMETGRQHAEEGRTRAEHTGEALRTIARAVATIADMNAQIAAGAEQQRGTARDIDERVASINTVASETADGARLAATSTDDLEHLATQLRAVVGEFRV